MCLDRGLLVGCCIKTVVKSRRAAARHYSSRTLQSCDIIVWCWRLCVPLGKCKTSTVDKTLDSVDWQAVRPSMTAMLIDAIGMYVRLTSAYALVISVDLYHMHTALLRGTCVAHIRAIQVNGVGAVACL